MDLLHKNSNWDLVQLSTSKKWIYKLKMIDSESMPKYKARLDTKGFWQQQGIDFEKIFSPIVKMTTLHYFLALIARMDFDLVQMDVKIAFLHDADLHEEFYCRSQKDLREKAQRTCSRRACMA